MNHLSLRWHAGFFALAFSVVTAAFAAPEFFAFDDGVGWGSWTPLQQATALKKLGYDGISYDHTTDADLAERLAVFKAQGLKIYALYLPAFVESIEHYNPALDQVLLRLRDTDTVLWLTVPALKPQGDHDAAVVRLIREIADLAQAHGVRIALYGHANLYLENAEDTVRIVKQVQRANVGATFNLCHEYFSKNGGQLEATIQKTAPYLTLASVNGVDVQGKNYIMRLDQGDFDVGSCVRQLRAAGYKGPIGLQCYGVKGDVVENLKANIAAWREIARVLD